MSKDDSIIILDTIVSCGIIVHSRHRQITVLGALRSDWNNISFLELILLICLIPSKSVLRKKASSTCLPDSGQMGVSQE